MCHRSKTTGAKPLRCTIQGIDVFLHGAVLCRRLITPLPKGISPFTARHNLLRGELPQGFQFHLFEGRKHVRLGLLLNSIAEGFFDLEKSFFELISTGHISCNYQTPSIQNLTKFVQ